MRRLIDIIPHRGEERIPRFQIPAGTCVVAVGDVHGHLTPLVDLHQKIMIHTRALPDVTRKIIVYLGDFTGSGANSADVIDLLLSAPLPGFEPVFLLGKHDMNLLSFIKGEGAFTRFLDQHNWGTIIARNAVHDETIMNWLGDQGGIETLRSYGVTIPHGPIMPLHLASMRHELLRKMPVDHIEFLQNLELSYQCGHYGFAHAGMNPFMPINQQNPSDLVCYKPDLRHTDVVARYVIVHGEAMGEEIGTYDNRINIDAIDETNHLVGLIMMRDKRVFI
jgi:serine/threonine protein phosphatase 1